MNSVKGRTIFEFKQELTEKTWKYIAMMNISSPECFLKGRITAYGMDNGFDTIIMSTNGSPKAGWRKDFAKVLDKGGFVRHDIDYRWFRIAMLYNMASCEDKFPTSINDIKTNTEYESMIPVSGAKIREIKKILKEHLDKAEYSFICNRFFGNTVLPDADICKKMEISRTDLMSIEIGAVKKMNKLKFPPIMQEV